MAHEKATSVKCPKRGGAFANLESCERKKMDDVLWKAWVRERVSRPTGGLSYLKGGKKEKEKGRGNYPQTWCALAGRRRAAGVPERERETLAFLTPRKYRVKSPT